MWLYPEIRALHQIPAHWATRTPDRVALRADTVAITYADLEAQVSALARALAGRFESADRRPVAFLGENSPELWEAWVGAGRAGRPFVPLNWRSPAPELAELVQDASPVIIFVSREFAEVIAQIRVTLETLIEIVVFDSVTDGGSGLSSWSLAQPTGEPTPSGGEDIALLAYTSGTTGRPKGAMVRNESFNFSFLSDELEPTISWSADDVMLMVMPNFHLAGTWVSLPALYHGATVAMLPVFEPTAVIAAIDTYKPTVACLVPTAIQLLVDSDAAKTADFSSLRTLVYAGSPMPDPVIGRALEILGCELRQFYGTTETYIITILRPDDHQVRLDKLTNIRSSCGRPVPLTHTRIVDPAGADLPTGQVGQVLVRSPMVMAGYFGKPEETAEVIRDGWYWTGDLGFEDTHGYLHLVDRAKDMVVTGGENVYSVEVERALQHSPKVAMAAVVGTPDERWGEAVTAYVVPSRAADGQDPSNLADELRAHTRQLIAAYKVPKIIHIVDALPMTSSGKIRKVDLRKINHRLSQGAHHDD